MEMKTTCFADVADNSCMALNTKLCIGCSTVDEKKKRCSFYKSRDKFVKDYYDAKIYNNKHGIDTGKYDVNGNQDMIVGIRKLWADREQQLEIRAAAEAEKAIT